MSENEDEEYIESQKITGQMCYDELEPIKEEEEKVAEQAVDGQYSFDDEEIKIKEQVDMKKKNDDKQIEMELDDITSSIENEISKKIISKDYKITKEKEVAVQIEPKKEVIKKPEIIDGIMSKSLDEVLHDSMIPYTEHVVMDRALPRVEDGLKPGQRRILYSMLELGVTPDKQYRKSARIVGDCMGKYHPHGDSSVYDAMVRMAQSFSLREPLVDGHGNFGSIDGDSAAAMRYTEAKLTPLAMELLRDLDKNTVRWSYNFDDTLKEPDMLPGRFPNLLVNGTSGIAVGVATNIPPHNLGEVIDGVVAYIDNPKMMLTDLMKYIKAPDFPTGGILHVGEDLMQAYRTGKGKITIRANTHIENDGDKQNIIITEMPYQVNKANLLQKIAELKDQEKERLSAISDIRDESDRNGMRAVIKIKKDGNAKAILDYLFKQTNLQLSFAFNMVAIAGGKPRQMGLLEIISYYVEYQRQVIFRRTKFELDEAVDRAHIVEGLLIAIDNINEVIKIIRKSENIAAAKQNLRERFKLSDKQAQAILDMRLARLVNLEKLKLEQELAELEEKIKKLTLIYNSKERQLKVVKTEILEIKKQFATPRKSKILGEAEIIEEVETIIENNVRDVIVAMTVEGKLKKLNIKNYNLSQKEINDNTDESDLHNALLSIKSDEKILIFTNLGNVLKVEVDKIPDCKWKDSGSIINAIDKNANPDEYAIAVLPLLEIEGKKLYFFTKKGMVKCSPLGDYMIAKSYFQAIKLKEKDEVLAVEYDKDESTVLMVSSTGMTLRFEENDIPIQSRISIGVMGINIDETDEIIYAGQVGKIGAITIITNKGFAKKVPIGVFDVMPRYRKGLRILTWKNNGEKLVLANFSDKLQQIAVKENKFKNIDTKHIVYENRTSVGKQIIKKNLKNAYIYLG